MGHCERNVWTPIGSRPWQKRKRASRLGGGNIMRAVLTGLSERRRRTSSPVRSRLAAISLGNKQPKTRPRVGTKKQGRSQVNSLSFHLVQKTPVRSVFATETHYQPLR